MHSCNILHLDDTYSDSGLSFHGLLIGASDGGRAENSRLLIDF
jgi:hypothetical protein